MEALVTYNTCSELLLEVNLAFLPEPKEKSAKYNETIKKEQ